MNTEIGTLSKGGLFSKVCLLLTGAMVLSAAGTWAGAGITSLGAIIVLAILFIAGAFAVPFIAKKSVGGGVAALAVWTFISGLFIGPSINFYAHALGWQTVAMAYVGTGAVMAGCGAFGALSGRNFSGMGKWLSIALLIMIVLGLVNIFFSFGHMGTIIYSLGGMVLFAGFFIFDFFRLSKSENTWLSAIMCTMQLYLDFINFLLYLLRFLLEVLGNRNRR